MNYLMLAGFVSSFAAGSVVAYKISQATINEQKVEIVELKAAIEKGNSEGKLAIEHAERLKEQAEHEAELKNAERDKGYEQQIDTINTYYDELRRLRQQASRSTTRHTDTLPGCNRTGVSETADTYTPYAQTFTEDNQRDAYKLEAYAKECRDFVLDNCGIR